MSSPPGIKLSQSEQSALRSLHATWPLSWLPAALRPYAELIRITKPAGVAMFYFPCLHGTFLVGALGLAGAPSIDLPSLLKANAYLLALEFLLRGALCTWNDIMDQDIDRRVARTRIRALARRAVSTPKALVFLALQTALVGLCFDKLLPSACLTYFLPFLSLHLLYPLAKRVTHHPQAILGLAFASGVWISFPALGRRLSLEDDDIPSLFGATALSVATVSWTLLYDTVYAAQDLADDKRAGTGSTMVYWEAHARDFLRALAGVTVAALITVSYPINLTSPFAGLIYTAFTCGGSAIGLLLMVENVKLDDPADCAWWFNTGNLWIGLAMSSGLVGASLVHVR